MSRSAAKGNRWDPESKRMTITEVCEPVVSFSLQLPNLSWLALLPIKSILISSNAYFLST